MAATRTYNYRNTKIATIWIGVAIACIIAIITLYNQAQIRAQAINSLTSASNAVASHSRSTGISKTTVSRTLGALVEDGELTKIERNGKPIYTLNTSIA